MISSKLCSFRIEKGGEMGAGHHAPLHYKIENYSFHSNNGEIGNNFLVKVNFTPKCIPCFAAETLHGVIWVYKYFGMIHKPTLTVNSQSHKYGF